MSSVDCSAQGDRLCDTSQPEGYCTIFSCEPDTCPEDTLCVGFGAELPPSCEAPDAADPRWPRFERTFCMSLCETDEDCRDGYQCLAPEDRASSSIDIELENRSSKVCFAASTAPAADPAGECISTPEP